MPLPFHQILVVCFWLLLLAATSCALIIAPLRATIAPNELQRRGSLEEAALRTEELQQQSFEPVLRVTVEVRVLRTSCSSIVLCYDR